MIGTVQKLADFLSGECSAPRVLVIGDVMLDTYLVGDVKRISPEAPVPVVRVNEHRHILGGAGNVAANVSGLGLNVALAGVVGNDDNGTKVNYLLYELKIDRSGIVNAATPTTTKIRIVGGHQQITRVDVEQVKEIDFDTEQKILAWFLENIDAPTQAIIISDYQKGVCSFNLCQQVITTANRRGIPVIVDPKGHDWSKYEGAYVITPNLKEIGEVCGEIPNSDFEVLNAARIVKDKYGVSNVLVTRSEKGMTLVSSEAELHIATRARDIFDVSGAGDTVIATLSAVIAMGGDLLEAVGTANTAAGIVVGIPGTSPIKVRELLEVVIADTAETTRHKKIVDVRRISSIVSQWKSSNAKIVFTNGCFDLLHLGHVTYLTKAKMLGDKLVVAINSDTSVKGLKGPNRPIIDEFARASMLAALECVDAVTIFDDETPEKLIESLAPTYLVKGGDYQVDEIVGREYAENVVTIPIVEGYSTTKILQKIVDVEHVKKEMFV